MLIKVKIKNFLSIKEEETIKINNTLTSIIGKNESGKSTVLKAIKKLNGGRITEKEKNSSLKGMSSEIVGTFRISKELVKEINKEYEDSTDYPFYSLPDDYGYLYYTIAVQDKDSKRYFSLFRMDDSNKLVRIDTGFAETRILDVLLSIKKDLESEEKLGDEQRQFFTDAMSIDTDVDLRDHIDAHIGLFDEEICAKLNSISSSIKYNHWIDLLPEQKFVYFNSFKDVLGDEVLIDDLDNNLQARNILCIGGLNIKELRQAVDENNEVTISDIEGKYIDVATQKFRDIFHQSDVDFKLKLRVATGSRKLYFLTYDKTSKNNAIPISDRSDGFRWYLSIYLTLYDYLESSSTRVDYTLLVDEPNLYLHPGAQFDLLHRVFQRELHSMQIVYTTHSPYMIDAENPATIRILSKDSQSHIYNNARDFAMSNPGGADVDTITPLLTSLELSPYNDVIFNREEDKLVIVEGVQDSYVLKTFVKQLKKTSDFEHIKFVPCYGAEKVPFMFSYLSSLGYNVLVCLDNDKAGRKAIKIIADGEDSSNFAYCYRKAMPDKSKVDCALEDLFSESDKAKFLPSKQTPLYRALYDRRDEDLEFDIETRDNFSLVLDRFL